MPSEIGRGIKFGIGFALGVGVIFVLFLLSLSMCASNLHRHMLERMEEMIPKERRPDPRTGDDPVALESRQQLLFVAARNRAVTFTLDSLAVSSGEVIPDKYTSRSDSLHDIRSQ